MALAHRIAHGPRTFDDLLRRLVSSIGLAAGVAATYFIAARLSLALLTKPDGVAVFWPAAGVAAGLLISRGPTARGAVVGGIVAATILANVLGDRNLWSACVFAASNVLEAVLVASLIDRLFGTPFSLNGIRRVLGFLAVALIGTAVSGVAGTLGYILFHTSTAAPLTIWLHWFASDGVGIISVAPLLIELSSASRDRPRRREVVEGVLALGIFTVLSSVVVHLPGQPWAVEIVIAALFPLLLWIAARCGPVFSAVATFVFALTIVWTTTFGFGIFGSADIGMAERILSAQFSIVAQSLCALVLAALFAERRQHIATLLKNQMQLRDALQAAQQADRAKSSFLAAASHDLRQPLQSLNLLQASLRPHLHNDEARTLLAGIDRSVVVMNGMLISLLDIHRLEAGTLRPSLEEFAVNDLFESMAADFTKPIAEKGLAWRLVQSKLWVRSDKQLLEEMLRNLLSNAVRYTDQGKIVVGCRRAGNNALIQVWDSGVGIMGNDIPRIFEEYYQAPGSSQLGGFGLGLAIVQRLAKVLDHHVDVRSTPGRGSGFLIEVPLALVAARNCASSTISEVSSDRSISSRVLIVEDESSVRASLMSLLRSKGLDVTVVATSDEALAQVASKDAAFDLVLTDYNLPGEMTGLDTVGALRDALGWKIPAIVLTGDTRKDVVEAIAESGYDFVVKPVRANELLQMIEVNLGRASGLSYFSGAPAQAV